MLAQVNVIGKDITILDKFATKELNRLYSKYDKTESTIYHFGLNKKENSFVGYAYRSKNDFKSETLQNSIGIKPPDEGIAEFLQENYKTTSDYCQAIVATIIKLKESDDKKGDAKVGIGGHIHILRLNKERQYMWEAYEFPDYREQFLEMLMNLYNGGGKIV